MMLTGYPRRISIGGKMATSDKERAKRIIVEVIRQAGGTLENKTNLFKAFYLAHLSFAESQPGYLSHYPIVRMPKGPGIDNAGRLLSELVRDGSLEIDSVQRGDFEAFCFRLTDKAPDGGLSEEEIEAIRDGVQCVQGITATRASKISHKISRSWQAADNGEELDIYIDLLDDDDYASLRDKMRKTASLLSEVWRD